MPSYWRRAQSKDDQLAEDHVGKRKDAVRLFSPRRLIAPYDTCKTLDRILKSGQSAVRQIGWRIFCPARHKVLDRDVGLRSESFQLQIMHHLIAIGRRMEAGGSAHFTEKELLVSDFLMPRRHLGLENFSSQ